MVRQIVLALFLSTGGIAGQTQNPTATTSKLNLAPLFANIWRITSATPYPNSSSIYIFLRNGTLFETSCVETYRVATWKAEAKTPNILEVTEDGRVAFTAKILSLTSRNLHLRQTLALGNREVRDLTLTAIDKEFVCPDMPR
jgi:hypothetical protein